MVAVMTTDAGRARRLFAEAYDASAAGFARSADRLVYAYLARPLARALAEADGPVLDVAAGSGALGRLLPAAVALDLSAAQLRHNPLPARLQGDAERLPFRDDAFAAAGCAFGDAHFPDPGTATQPVAAGYMANAYVRLRHPDYDVLRGMLDDVGRTVHVHAA